jgi:hypothetical protein
MANIVDYTLIEDGPKKAIVQFYFESDGNEGEFVNRVILDPYTDFAVPWQINPDADRLTNPTPPRMTILQMWSSASWFDMTLSYEGVTVKPSFVIARDSDFYMDFRYFGGVKDRVTDTPTGRLMLSTKDFAPLGSNGFLVLEVKKD